MVQAAPWFMMQTLTAACNRGLVEFGRKLSFNVYKLFFHDDAERQLMATGPHTYSTYDTFEPRIQTVIPPAPQAPQMSKKDMMRALGMGGFGSFFSGGNLPNVGFHSHAMPAAPGLSFHIATSLQCPGFEISTWHGGSVESVAPSFLLL